MNDFDSKFERLRQKLWAHNRLRHGECHIPLAFLIRSEDWRPLKASWWRGKEARIVGGTLGGDYLLHHCDGTFRLWRHSEQKDEIVAKSVEELASRLDVIDGA